jgi:REP element-mobilizing transposase RayT
MGYLTNQKNPLSSDKIFQMSVKYKIRDQHGLHFLTSTVCGWVDLFSRQTYRDILLDSWRYCAAHKGLQIWGYVIMPNHVHWIASASPPYRLENVVRDFKAHTARKFLEVLHDKNQVESRRDWMLYLFSYFATNKKDQQQYQVWQHDNHPIELYSENVVIQKLRYIHNNPVKAKLVAQPEDWLYSSAGNYLHGKGIFEVQVLWPSFEEEGGWFFGNVDFPSME